MEFALIYDEINQLLLVNVLRARVIPMIHDYEDDYEDDQIITMKIMRRIVSFITMAD